METLTARKGDIAGLAVASDERIEAYVLYLNRRVDPDGNTEPDPQASALTEILALRTLIEDGGACLKQLLSRLGLGTFRFSKVHPAEISKECLETLGFRPADGQLLYATRARSG